MNKRARLLLTVASFMLALCSGACASTSPTTSVTNVTPVVVQPPQATVSTSALTANGSYAWSYPMASRSYAMVTCDFENLAANAVLTAYVASDTTNAFPYPTLGFHNGNVGTTVTSNGQYIFPVNGTSFLDFKVTTAVTGSVSIQCNPLASGTIPYGVDANARLLTVPYSIVQTSQTPPSYANGTRAPLALDVNGYLDVDCMVGCSGSSGGSTTVTFPTALPGIANTNVLTVQGVPSMLPVLGGGIYPGPTATPNLSPNAMTPVALQLDQNGRLINAGSIVDPSPNPVGGASPGPFAAGLTEPLSVDQFRRLNISGIPGLFTGAATPNPGNIASVQGATNGTPVNVSGIYHITLPTFADKNNTQLQADINGRLLTLGNAMVDASPNPGGGIASPGPFTPGTPQPLSVDQFRRLNAVVPFPVTSPGTANAATLTIQGNVGGIPVPVSGYYNGLTCTVTQTACPSVTVTPSPIPGIGNTANAVTQALALDQNGYLMTDCMLNCGGGGGGGGAGTTLPFNGAASTPAPGPNQGLAIYGYSPTAGQTHSGAFVRLGSDSSGNLFTNNANDGSVTASGVTVPPVAPASGASSGIIGWLYSIYTELAGTLTVQSSPNVMTSYFLGSLSAAKACTAIPSPAQGSVPATGHVQRVFDNALTQQTATLTLYSDNACATTPITIVGNQQPGPSATLDLQYVLSGSATTLYYTTSAAVTGYGFSVNITP